MCMRTDPFVEFVPLVLVGAVHIEGALELHAGRHELTQQILLSAAIEKRCARGQERELTRATAARGGASER